MTLVFFFVFLDNFDVCFYISFYFLKKNEIFLFFICFKLIFLMFSDYFDILILKINFNK